MKVLAIGNSFSQDATYYLQAIASADQTEMKVVNLYIGGCSLERHWQNLYREKKEYSYELNGHATGKYVSIQEAVMEEEWDVIVTQQASHDSGWSDTYEPFLSDICAWLTETQPQARLFLQKTWAYEIDSTHEGFWRYRRDQKEMFMRLSAAYDKAAKENGLACIPCADVIQLLRKEPAFDYANGGMSLCRDGFHMHHIYGRYALAATWYAVLCGKKMTGHMYMPKSEFLPDEEAKIDLILLIQETIDRVLDGNDK